MTINSSNVYSCLFLIVQTYRETMDSNPSKKLDEEILSNLSVVCIYYVDYKPKSSCILFSIPSSQRYIRIESDSQLMWNVESKKEKGMIFFDSGGKYDHPKTRDIIIKKRIAPTTSLGLIPHDCLIHILRLLALTDLLKIRRLNMTFLELWYQNVEFFETLILEYGFRPTPIIPLSLYKAFLSYDLVQTEVHPCTSWITWFYRNYSQDSKRLTTLSPDISETSFVLLDSRDCLWASKLKSSLYFLCADRSIPRPEVQPDRICLYEISMNEENRKIKKISLLCWITVGISQRHVVQLGKSSYIELVLYDRVDSDELGARPIFYNIMQEESLEQKNFVFRHVPESEMEDLDCFLESPYRSPILYAKSNCPLSVVRIKTNDRGYPICTGRRFHCRLMFMDKRYVCWVMDRLHCLDGCIIAIGTYHVDTDQKMLIQDISRFPLNFDMLKADGVDKKHGYFGCIMDMVKHANKIYILILVSIHWWPQSEWKPSGGDWKGFQDGKQRSLSYLVVYEETGIYLWTQRLPRCVISFSVNEGFFLFKEDEYFGGGHVWFQNL